MPSLLLALLLSHSAEAKELGLSGEHIKEKIESHSDAIRDCYIEGIKRNPKLQGDLKMQIEIDPTGKVVKTLVDSSTVDDSELESCISKLLMTVEFDEPKGKIRVQAYYPFHFHQTNANQAKPQPNNK